MHSYQLLDVRSSAKPKAIRAQRTIGGATAQGDSGMGPATRGGGGGGDESEEDVGPVKRSPKETAHIFDGVTRPRETAIFQICDITDPQLRPLIESKAYVHNQCNVRIAAFLFSRLLCSVRICMTTHVFWQ